MISSMKNNSTTIQNDWGAYFSSIDRNNNHASRKIIAVLENGSPFYCQEYRCTTAHLKVVSELYLAESLVMAWVLWH